MSGRNAPTTNVDVSSQRSNMITFADGSNKVQYLIALALSFGYMSVGCHLGWPSPVLLRLTKNTTEGPEIPDLTHSHVDWIVATVSISQLIFTPAIGLLSHQCGSRTLLLLSAGPGLASWMLLGNPTHLLLLYFGRFFAGIFFAFLVTVGHVYLAEVATKEIRGEMGTSFLVMLSLGIVFEYSAGPSLSYHMLAACSAFPLAIFTLSFALAPESPVFLVNKGEYDEATRALMTLRCRYRPEDVQEELTDIVESLDEDPVTWREILDRGVIYKVAFISTGLVLSDTLSGQIVIISHCSQILEMKNIGRIGLIQVAVAQLVSSTFVPFLMDKWGRRPLLLLSALLSAVFLIGLAVAADTFEKYDTDLQRVVFLVLLIGFITSETVLATITFEYIAEISCPHSRHTTMMCACMLYAAMAIGVDVGYPQLMAIFGEVATCSVCAAFCLLATAFVFMFIPETKGKTLHEIQREMDEYQLWPPRR